MSRIAVVGCGAFGALAALRLEEAGHDVTVFERLSGPLQGASFNNQNRLHLGFHYPRDAETARQCVRGFNAFRAQFSDCITDAFPNAYFIAQEGSKTSVEEYVAFCNAVGLAYRRIELNDLPIAVRGVAAGFLCDEAVYDARLLGSAIAKMMERSGVALEFNCEIARIEPSAGRYAVTLTGGRREVFDGIVNATYANLNTLARDVAASSEERQFEYTIVPILQCDFSRIGITVMDGPFTTVLPFGLSDRQLVYHVEHSVVERQHARAMDPSWLDPKHSPFARLNRQAYCATLLEACADFIPDLRTAKVVGCLEGPRMVLPRRDDTDARPSIVTIDAPGFVSLFSGKIDHCTWVAEDVVRIFADRA